MITDYNRLSGLHRVAILFSVLGESLAISLIKGLSRTEVRKIRATIREMGNVSFTLKRRVMEEFYFGFLSEQFSDESDDDKDEGPIKPFEFLTEMTDEQLIALLANEDVPVVGIALAQLGPEKRMIILERMKPEQKGKVLIELGSLQEIPLEAIVEVAGKLKEKASYLPKPVEFSRGGAKEIADLIGEMDADEGERYMQTLQNENSELYKAVKMLVLTFEDILENFPDGILRDLCNSVELDALSMAMKGIDQEIVDRVIGNLPQKKQAMFEPVEGPKPKREVDDARKIIVSAAKEMEKEGVFNLADMMGGGEMVE
jgi:flagellar motor switch protein FliG|tara:strand:+ start:6718 stop:7662 length:945 start_codon:yes stop_codon:yes gene_type:complete